jgi:hypothetical protein
LVTLGVTKDAFATLGPIHVAAWLGACRVTGTEFEEVINLCRIRIVPVDGVGPGMAFRLMDYTDQPACGHVRYLTGSVFLDRPDTLALYPAHLGWLDQHAWQPDQSHDTLQTWATRYAVPDTIPNASHTAVLNGQKEIAR